MLMERMPEFRIDSIVELGEGSDHLAYEVNSKLIVRVAKDADPNRRSELVRN